jgi:hypothetical protein
VTRIDHSQGQAVQGVVWRSGVGLLDRLLDSLTHDLVELSAVGVDLQIESEPCGHRIGRQEVPTMRVNRADREVIERADEGTGTTSHLRLIRGGNQLRLEAHDLRWRFTRYGRQSLCHPPCHLGGGGFGERDRHHSIQHMGGDLRVLGLAVAALDQAPPGLAPATTEAPAQHPRDQHGRLAGSGPGFHRHRTVELGLRQAAGLDVHG